MKQSFLFPTRFVAATITLAVSLATSATAQQKRPVVAPPLTDPEIAHVAVSANAIDVELARYAKEITTHPEVRRFAETMITDHTAVNEQAAALAKRLGVVPADNGVSRSLRDGAREASARLADLRGSAFDRAYLEREVAYHQAVLDALDQVLIPSTGNADLRALLQGVRPAIAAHLEHAKTLRASLQKAR